ETFELLTLLQTGKATPAPIVLLDIPGGTYWRNWRRFLDEEIVARDLAGPNDMLLCRITDDVGTALDEILGFYRNYHSIRFVGRRLVIRIRAEPTASELVLLNEMFGDICLRGGIERVDPLSPELADKDHLELVRLAFEFDRMSYGRLRVLIDTVNGFSSSPRLATPDRDSVESAATAPGLETS
ncbi:MAG TPA: LOG family protein, partial [Acidimicrobiales bacterium]